jgi:hypothetical protein
MSFWSTVKSALAPMPPCAQCGKPFTDTDHSWWDPGWPSMPVGKEPIDHWYVEPVGVLVAE